MSSSSAATARSSAHRPTTSARKTRSSYRLQNANEVETCHRLRETTRSTFAGPGARHDQRSGTSKRAKRTQRLEAIRMSRSEEHTSELQSLAYLVCRLLLEKKN